MKRYADFILTLIMVWTLTGLAVLVITAGIAGPDSTVTSIVAVAVCIPLFAAIGYLLAREFAGRLRDEWRHARANRATSGGYAVPPSTDWTPNDDSVF